MKKYYLPWITAIACLLWLAPTAMAGKITQFQAKQVHLDQAGQIRTTNQIYSMPDKLRLEMNHPSGQGSMIMIFRKDKEVHWILSPKNKRYTEQPMDEAAWERTRGDFIKAQNMEDLGMETVQGFRCRKRRVTTTVQVMGVKRTSTSTVWSSPKIAFPIRTESQTGEVTELRNIKKGVQPDALFEIPCSYTQVSSMIELGSANMAPKTSQPEAEQTSPFLKLPDGKKMPDWLKDKLKNLQE